MDRRRAGHAKRTKPASAITGLDSNQSGLNLPACKIWARNAQRFAINTAKAYLRWRRLMGGLRCRGHHHENINQQNNDRRRDPKRCLERRGRLCGGRWRSNPRTFCPALRVRPAHKLCRARSTFRPRRGDPLQGNSAPLPRHICSSASGRAAIPRCTHVHARAGDSASAARLHGRTKINAARH